MHFKQFFIIYIYNFMYKIKFISFFDFGELMREKNYFICERTEWIEIKK